MCADDSNTEHQRVSTTTTQTHASIAVGCTDATTEADALIGSHSVNFPATLLSSRNAVVMSEDQDALTDVDHPVDRLQPIIGIKQTVPLTPPIASRFNACFFKLLRCFWFACFLFASFVILGFAVVRIGTLDRIPLFGGKRQDHLLVPWTDTTDRPDSVFCSDTLFRRFRCLKRGPKGEIDLTVLKPELFRHFGTKFGCPVTDLKAAKADVIETVSREPAHPFRIALLFWVADQLSHPSVWKAWVEDARRWSREQFEKREGPYASLSKEPTIKSDEEVDLFSVFVHIRSANKTVMETVTDDLRANFVPPVDSKWERLTPMEYQLLKHSVRDSRNAFFVMLSDSTLPVKPFRYIYQKLMQNPRSRFFFINVNLPIIRKHDSWIILSRSHAIHLVEYSSLWTCSKWLYQPFGNWRSQAYWGGPDEYLPFLALSTISGFSKIWEQINDGVTPRGLPVLNWNSVEPSKYYGLQFQHTWVRWFEWGGVPFKDYKALTGSIGPAGGVKHPLTFRTVQEKPFERILLNDSNIWFARKFSPTCFVEGVDNSANLTNHEGKVDLASWLILKLQSFPFD